MTSTHQSRCTDNSPTARAWISRGFFRRLSDVRPKTSAFYDSSSCVHMGIRYVREARARYAIAPPSAPHASEVGESNDEQRSGASCTGKPREYRCGGDLEAAKQRPLARARARRLARPSRLVRLPPPRGACLSDVSSSGKYITSQRP